MPEVIVNVFPDTEVSVPVAEVDIDETEMDVLLEKHGPVVLLLLAGMVGTVALAELLKSLVQ